jgi:Fibronectin type III domain
MKTINYLLAVLIAITVAACGGGGGGGGGNSTVPGAPTAVTATAGNTTAIVSFTAPASNGGAAITGYTVTSSTGNKTATGTSSPITVTGLTNGTAYTFTVVATNSIGSSVASAASNSVKPVAPSASTTALGSYIADGLNGSFVGSWNNYGAGSAEAYPTSLATTGIANTYALTWGDKLLTSVTWSANPSPSGLYDLISTGWIPSPSTGTLVDSGDGINVTITPTGESAVADSITKTSLTGAITCFDATGAVMTCTAPNSYPTGAAEYTHTQGTGPYYSLWAGVTGATPVTDATGTALTALPAIGSTFCDPLSLLVFQAITPTPGAGANNYWMFNTASCAPADITTARGTTPDTVLISTQVTNNSAVPSVLILSGATVITYMNGAIYGLRANNVWPGYITPAGWTWTEENKIAINAELVASGFAPIP